MVDFGLDTGSATMVERMQKAASARPTSNARARRSEHANAIGLHHGIYIIFNFPGETPETVRETQAYIDEPRVRRRADERLARRARASSSCPAPVVPADGRRTPRVCGTEIRHPAGGASAATTTRWPPTCCRARPGAAARRSSPRSARGTSPSTSAGARATRRRSGSSDPASGSTAVPRRTRNLAPLRLCDPFDPSTLSTFLTFRLCDSVYRPVTIGSVIADGCAKSLTRCSLPA